MFTVLLAGVMLPQITLAIPQYFLVSELGLTSWFAACLVLPFRVFETRIHYLDPQTGQPGG